MIGNEETTDRPWWRDALFYRVDVRTFADADGDGVGDLEGLRARLGYTELFGADALVLTGVPSPEGDSFTSLVDEVHQSGMRLLIAADFDPYEQDARAVLQPWLRHGVDGVHLAPRDDPDGVVRGIVDEFPERIVLGTGKGPWHLAFNLELAVTGFDPAGLPAVIDRILDGPNGAPTRQAWAMASRDAENSRTDAALTPVRSMALVQLALPGAVCLRHGEELGLPGTRPVPMPWEGGTPPFGFSPMPGDWEQIPPAWSEFTVESQLEDADSTLSLYRKAVQLRNEHSAFTGDGVEWFGAPEGCFAFRRTGHGLTCALNVSAERVPAPPGELLLSSRPLRDGELEPGTAAWLAS